MAPGAELPKLAEVQRVQLSNGISEPIPEKTCFQEVNSFDYSIHGILDVPDIFEKS